MIAEKIIRILSEKVQCKNRMGDQKLLHNNRVFQLTCTSNEGLLKAFNH